MRRVLGGYGVLTYRFPGTNHPFAGFVALMALLAAGLSRIRVYLQACWRERRLLPDAVALTVAFCLFNIVYLAAVTILLSHQDMPRYRNEVSTLYAGLLGILIVDAGRRLARRGAPGRKAPRLTA